MEIIRVDEKMVEIRQIDPFFVDLLRQIPFETDPGDDEIARERLYSNPLDDPTDDFNEEWQTYVGPELSHLFQEASDTVAGDLKNLERTKDATEETMYSLPIPVNHLDQWLNTLNQARLVIAARNRFTDEELAADFSPVINSKRDMNLLQIHIYGFLQEIFLREIE